MDYQPTIDHAEKVERSIRQMQLAANMSKRYYEKPLLVCYSGGKDSDALVELALESGVEFEVQHIGCANTTMGLELVSMTPTSDERLQGFPSGWTDVPYKGKEHPSDTPRYKACGNSMAVPVMRWIGSRIQMVDEMEVEQ